MPSFAFDSGLLVPTVLGRRTSSPLTPPLRQALRNYLLDVLEVDLFPIHWSDEKDPVLTALDPAGQVVTAVVVDSIDGAGLVRTLARAGENAASSWLEIASRYPGGVAEFRPAWAAFRQARPLGAQPGPQLYVLAGSVDPEVLSATRVLHCVRVYSVDVRDAAGGRPVVDVAPVHNATIRVLDHDVVYEPEHLALSPGQVSVSGDETVEISHGPVGAEEAPSRVAVAEPEREPEPDQYLAAVARLVGAPIPLEAKVNSGTLSATLTAAGFVDQGGRRHPTLEAVSEAIGSDPARAWLLWQVAGFPIADARDEVVRIAARERAARQAPEGTRRRRH